MYDKDFTKTRAIKNTICELCGDTYEAVYIYPSIGFFRPVYKGPQVYLQGMINNNHITHSYDICPKCMRRINDFLLDIFKEEKPSIETQHVSPICMSVDLEKIDITKEMNMLFENAQEEKRKIIRETFKRVLGDNDDT